MTVEMTPEYWQAARLIAQELSTTNTDVNELKKVVAYLCWLRNREGMVQGDRDCKLDCVKGQNQI
jgi:hypothetical protein